jgi:hypothetical protein
MLEYAPAVHRCARREGRQCDLQTRVDASANPQIAYWLPFKEGVVQFVGIGWKKRMQLQAAEGERELSFEEKDADEP